MDSGNYRTISLMSHTLKLFLQIILQRVRRKLILQIKDYQYRFMSDRRTRNAIFTLRMLCERAIEHQQNVFLCFIDYQKAFDKVRHNLLLNMLKYIGIDDKDYRIIHNQYFQQKSAIKLNEDLSQWIDIRRGVRQGCVMSSNLFILYSEFILGELEEIEEGTQINGQRINNIQYACNRLSTDKPDLIKTARQQNLPATFPLLISRALISMQNTHIYHYWCYSVLEYGL